MTKEIINRCNEVVESYINEKAVDPIGKAFSILKGHLTPSHFDDLIDTLNDANSWINICAGEDRELYEEYRFRLFEKNGEFYMAQGNEVTEIDPRRNE